ncbi:MAG: hypothetical protein IPJ87_11080 [Flavobacteriales bacterium]|jgi:hypothetical protein|nr:hypothetical protein [Flavobacteriales bacterium]MBK7942397.1 hypothetical protein [Flavobacteriales bacterium]MBK8948213.1 hypothetical protein [Flavobacteriales bacterium]MBK9699201.1 hypothetical protein [Flavobacteriales bacterium]
MKVWTSLLNNVRGALVLVLVIMAGCKKEDDATTPAANGGGYGSSYALSLELDGIPVLKTTSTDIFVPGAMANTNMGLTVCTSYQESVVSDSVDVNDRWNVGLVKTFYGLGSLPSVDSVNTMVALGARSYGVFLWNQSTLTYEVVDGVRVEWTDALGVKWSTDRGTADQTGSNFSINERTSTGDPFGPRFTFKVTFNCKLYDGAGNSKLVTNGALHGPLITQ